MTTTQGNDELQQHAIRLNQGGTFNLTATRQTLMALGPAILSYLGCSYEIRWPDKTEEEKRRRAHDHKVSRERMRQKADEHASHHLPHWIRSEDREDVQQILKEAYIAGWRDAPKGPNSHQSW